MGGSPAVISNPRSREWLQSAHLRPSRRRARMPAVRRFRSFPEGNAKATGYWFPRSERGLATAIFDSAAKFSNVIGAPLVALAVVNFGWRGAFWCMAVLNFAYFLAFYLVYRDPSADRRLSAAEHEYILAGGGAVEGAAPSGAGAMLGYLLSTRKIWGLTIGGASPPSCGP